MREPTSDECTNKSIVFGDKDQICYACWYPQMGGYVGKCVASFDIEGCIELDVWHDGEFPFSEVDGNPAHLHICSPEQFIEFGEFLTRINENNRKVVNEFEGEVIKESE